MLAYFMIRGWLPFARAVERVLRPTPAHSTRVARRNLCHRHARCRTRAADLLYLLEPYAQPGLRGDDELVATLRRQCLSDNNPRARFAAIGALHAVRHAELLALVPQLMTDADPRVRWHALALAAGGGDGIHAEGTPYLIAALDDPEPQVRTYVHQRLCRNTGQRFPFDPHSSRAERLHDQAAWQTWWESTGP